MPSLLIVEHLTQRQYFNPKIVAGNALLDGLFIQDWQYQ